MFPRFNHRAGHYALLCALAVGLYLPNLGAPTLWDIDEGNNAEAAREMLASGNWVVPTFNFQLRVDKPALLYWLQIGAYQLFGVNEFAARLPSALAALVAVLLTYELGRLLFGAATGLLAGLILASTVMFSAAAHFANPDALLTACTTLTFFCFLRDYYRGGRTWFLTAGASAGLAVLAKGPVGLALPLAVTGLFLLWSRRWRLLLDRRLLWGMLVFCLVALPWYGWVGAETKGEFLRGFLLTHNVGRFRAAMEGHHGKPYYYALVLVVGFAPWSAFLGLAGWSAWKECRQKIAAAAPPNAIPDPRSSVGFLVCWIAVYFIFFSLSSTKLPNYILPLYAPVALLTARCLDRWRRGDLAVPAWATRAGLMSLVLVGAGGGVGLLVAGGALDLAVLHGRHLPGLERYAALGLIPVLGAGAAGWWARRGQVTGLVTSVAVSAVLFVGSLAALAGRAVEAYKAPRPLVQTLNGTQTAGEIRIGSYQYFQPSLVFYCQREVARLNSEEDARAFLRCPLPIYLFVPAPVWEQLRAKGSGSCRLLDRHPDLYQGCDVVLVTNQ